MTDEKSIIRLLNRICVIISAICIGGMIFVASVVFNRTSIKADIIKADDDTVFPGLIFSLPEGVDSSLVAADFSLKSAIIKIPSENEKFYYDNALIGDSSHIESLLYGYEDGNAVFDIGFDDNCECVLEDIENGRMQLLIEPITEKYENIFVIDPLHGGNDSGSVAFGVRESDINLKFAKALKETLESEDSVVFLTRTGDIELSEEERIKIADELNAKCLIRIGMKASTTTRVKHGIEYVASDYADVLSLESAFGEEEISAKHLSSSVYDDYAGDRLVVIYPGYITNKGDITQLSDETYTNRLCEIISQGLK